MNIDLAALPDDVETLQQLVRFLAVERTALTEAQAEIERLHLVIKKLQRNQFGRRAERLDDGQFQLGFEDLGADIGRVEVTLPLAAAKTPSSRLLIDRPSMPAHLPREEMQLDIEHQACPCCGSELHRIGETVSEMLDHVPARKNSPIKRAGLPRDAPSLWRSATFLPSLADLCESDRYPTRMLHCAGKLICSILLRDG